MFKDFISIIPLIGGMTISAENVFGKKPKKVYSYPGFQYNDKFYLKYKEIKNDEVDYEILENENTELETADLVVGLPPCAGLSVEGIPFRKDENSKVIKNSYMIQVVKDGIRAGAKLIIFENAPALFSKNEVEVKKELNEVVRKNGYSVTYYRTNSMLHEIPQNRKRTYAIISKTEKALDMDFIKREMIPLKKYIKEKMGKDEKIVYQFKDKYKEEFERIIMMRDFIKRKLKENNLEEYALNHPTPLPFLKDITTKEEILQEFEKKFNKFIEKIENDFKDNKEEYDKKMKLYNKRKNTFVNNIERYFNGKHRLYFKFFQFNNRDYVNTLIHGKYSLESLVTDYEMTLNEFLHLMGLPSEMLKIENLNIMVMTQNAPVKTSQDIIELAIDAYKKNKFAKSDVFFIDNIKNEKEIREDEKKVKNTLFS